MLMLHVQFFHAKLRLHFSGGLSLRGTYNKKKKETKGNKTHEHVPTPRRALLDLPMGDGDSVFNQPRTVLIHTRTHTLITYVTRRANTVLCK